MTDKCAHHGKPKTEWVLHRAAFDTISTPPTMRRSIDIFKIGDQKSPVQYDAQSRCACVLIDTSYRYGLFFIVFNRIEYD